jgi:SPP1 family predicted phage head-tail adaptor
LRAGALRHRINLIRQSSTKGTYGDDVVSWSTDKSVWAAVWPIKGNEYYQAQQVSSVVTHRIRIRHTTFSNSTAISARHRIEMKDGARMWEIESVINPEEENRMLDMMCKETTSSG